MVITLWSGAVDSSPDIQSAVVRLHAFQACSSLGTVEVDNYPNTIVIGDSCLGGSLTAGNRHIWRLSEDDINDAVFGNADSFVFGADLRVIGGFGLVGLQVAPWWSPDFLGRFGVDLDYGWFWGGGEGRLPGFAFVRPEHDFLRYQKGRLVRLEMTYLANGLSQASPATIEYRVIYNGETYTSGPLPFTEGNPADDPPYGRWGILNDSRVGGFMDFDTTRSGVNHLRAEWSNIEFEVITGVSVSPGTWSRVKSLYRD